MRLNQVTVIVTDINRSVEFYRGLGLSQIVGADSRYARFLCPDGDATFSIEKKPGVIPQSTTIIYFECDNLDHTVSELKSKGYVFDQDPIDQSWLWREAYLRDPDGNIICLYYAGENRINPPWRLK
ncbi:VOC family protein [Microseira wollei]|uniref:Glyoxalase/bleomycin resistance protein/dioxygenase n=1 Tax=Microseira wollei NIES-4236 TaxID=2530354 RepID=A0AAV3WJC1_9CYAN|nr:VOC family protein [Microseira wollei]GET40089.1 glyoxalase/bleomycin resistance protein/dioxygenase [Microseira wollei NIES-4236]